MSMLIRYNEVDITVIVLSTNQFQSEFIDDELSSIALNKNPIMPYLHKESADHIPLLINLLNSI